MRKAAARSRFSCRKNLSLKIPYDGTFRSTMQEKAWTHAIGWHNDVWLDPGITDAQVVSELLKPYGGKMRSYPVSTRINHVVNDDAECSRTAEITQAQNSLFM